MSINLTNFTENVNNVSSLDDTPSITSTELKAVFDKAGVDLKSFINNTLIPEITNQVLNEISTINNSISTTNNNVATNTTNITNNALLIEKNRKYNVLSYSSKDDNYIKYYTKKNFNPVDGDIFYLQVPSLDYPVLNSSDMSKTIQISVNGGSNYFTLKTTDNFNLKLETLQGKRIKVCYVKQTTGSVGEDYFIFKDVLKNILYNNADGSGSSVTLSNNSVNYTKLLIEFKTNDGHFGSMIICPKATNQKILLNTQYCIPSSNVTYLKTSIWNLDGTTITSQSQFETILSSTVSHSTGQFIFITKVIGYIE